MPPATRNAFRYLCWCLSRALVSSRACTDLPAGQSEWEGLLHLSGEHLVVPQLRWALREQGLWAALPAEVADYLDAVYTLNLERNCGCEEQLRELVTRLNGIGVVPVLLKGAAALIDGLYPTAGERMMSDLDVLVPANRLPEGRLWRWQQWAIARSSMPENGCPIQSVITRSGTTILRSFPATGRAVSNCTSMRFICPSPGCSRVMRCLPMDGSRIGAAGVVRSLQRRIS